MFRILNFLSTSFNNIPIAVQWEASNEIILAEFKFEAEILSEDWRGELTEVISYLRELREARDIIAKQDMYSVDFYNMVCCRLQIRLHVLTTPELESASGENYECGICKEQLVHPNGLSLTRKNRARILLDLDLQKIGLLAKECLGHVSSGSNGEVQVLEDLRPIVYRLIKACSILKKIRELPYCTYAIKTKCGHVFGMPCLMTWVVRKVIDMENFSCPYCRAEITAPVLPRYLRDYVPQMSWHEEEDEAGYDSELEDGYFSGDLAPSRNSAIPGTGRSHDGDGGAPFYTRLTSLRDMNEEGLSYFQYLHRYVQ